VCTHTHTHTHSVAQTHTHAHTHTTAGATGVWDSARATGTLPLLWSFVRLIIFGVKVAQFINEGHGAAALAGALYGLPYVLHILAASIRLSVRLPRALRGVDACAAVRIYKLAVLLAMLASGINPVPRAPEHLNYGMLVPVLCAWFERPRSPALGVALSLLEIPVVSLIRWHALACCGQATSAGQALAEVSLRAAVLTTVHVAVWWWAPTTLPTTGTRAGRATRIKLE
jgi:hypothetical protein